MKYILFIYILFFVSCSMPTKEQTHQEELKPKENEIVKNIPKEAIRYVKVKSDTLKLQSQPIKNSPKIDKIKVFGANFYDVLMLLIEATGESIVVEQQTNNIEAGLNLKNNFDVYLSADNIGFGQVLQKLGSNKLSVDYDNGIYYLNSVKKCTIKIPPIKELSDSIVKALPTFGATDVVYDNVTSSLSFVAKQKDYTTIIEYINNLKKNLYVIEYDIAIYNVILSDSYGMGIDWDILRSRGIDYKVNTTNTLGDLENSTPLQFGIVKNSALLSATALIKMLETFGKVESIQRPTLLGLAGTSVKLKDGLEESYVSEVSNTTTTVGTQSGTTSTKVLSGIDISLNANLLDETVITNIQLAINDVVGYTEFTTASATFRQPKVMTKNINNTIRVKAGEPILISGLFRSETNKGYRGIPNTSSTPLALLGGANTSITEKSEMVVIVTPRIIKYIME